MDSRQLARPVTIAGVTYHPGDPVPADVAAKITNPKAWLPLGSAPAPSAANAGGTSGGYKLARSVTVDGRTYAPTDRLSDEVAAKIRNPKAWAGGVLPVFAAAAPDTTEQPETGGEQVEAVAEPDEDKPRKAKRG